MWPAFKSGAFVQRRFSVHPRWLVLKKLALLEKLSLACTAYNLQHRLTLRALTTRSPVSHLPHGGTSQIQTEWAPDVSLLETRQP